MNPSTIEIIQVFEMKLREAMLTSDIGALDALLAIDLIFTNHLGAVLTKQEDIEMHASGDLNIDDIKLSDQKILTYENTAIVTAKAELLGRYKGLEANGTFRFTRVWRKSNKTNWQVVVAHSSAVA